KIKPQWALVNGKPEQHPEGNFYISYRDGKKKIWKKIGKKIGPNPSDAVHAAYVEKSILNAKALGHRRRGFRYRRLESRCLLRRANGDSCWKQISGQGGMRRR
ncbi:MAG TPA: hypothetical protein VIX37_04765, partial [Candidatus Sulfotelmatobacter sp.]